ncbi:hypothetical protein GQR58_003138 [Nymphon striatum]|nr:hypothetical protein GQR58_003138 [Nymphon striatum]
MLPGKLSRLLYAVAVVIEDRGGLFKLTQSVIKICEVTEQRFQRMLSSTRPGCHESSKKLLDMHSGAKSYICSLMEMLWSRDVLSTHSLTGKTSNAHKDKVPKPYLDPEMVKQLCDLVSNKFNVDERQIHIKAKLNNVGKCHNIRIESSFNIMDDIVESDRSVMTVATYEDVAIVESALRAKDIKATEWRPNDSTRKYLIKAGKAKKVADLTKLVNKRKQTALSARASSFCSVKSITSSEPHSGVASSKSRSAVVVYMPSDEKNTLLQSAKKGGRALRALHMDNEKNVLLQISQAMNVENQNPKKRRKKNIESEDEDEAEEEEEEGYEQVVVSELPIIKSFTDNEYVAVAYQDNWYPACVIRTIDNDSALWIFARFGIPEKLIKDNGPQYTSHECDGFATEYGKTQKTSSPHYPNSNGLAGRTVQTVKRIHTKSNADNKDPLLGILEYHTTPLGIGYSPSKISGEGATVLPSDHGGVRLLMITGTSRRRSLL